MELRNGQSIEGMDTVFLNGGTAVAHAQREDPICAAGDRLRFTYRMTDCLTKTNNRKGSISSVIVSISFTSSSKQRA